MLMFVVLKKTVETVVSNVEHEKTFINKTVKSTSIVYEIALGLLAVRRTRVKRNASPAKRQRKDRMVTLSQL